MKNSTNDATFRETLTSILTALDDRHIRREYNDPLDRAAQTFDYDPGQSYTHAHFHKTIAKFIAHLYKQGLHLRQALTLDQAHDEAINILTRYYKGVHDTGYDGMPPIQSTTA